MLNFCLGGSQTVMILPPRGHLHGSIFICHNWGCGYWQWHLTHREAWGAAKHLVMHRTVCPAHLNIKNCLVQNVSTARLSNPALTQWFYLLESIFRKQPKIQRQFYICVKMRIGALTSISFFLYKVCSFRRHKNKQNI